VAAKRSSPKTKKRKTGKKPANDTHEFVAEAEEILDRMFEDLSDLQDQRCGGGEVDPDLVNRIFRSAHSLKGLAGMFGLDAIGELAHHLEDILDGLRLGRVRFDSPVVGLLDEGVSLLSRLMSEIDGSDASSTEGPEAAQAFIRQIEEAIEAPSLEARDELDELDMDPSLLQALTEYEEHRLRENLQRGRHIALVDSTFEIANFEEGLSELSSAVREVGEVVSTLPSPGAAPESQIRFSLLVATEVHPDRLRERLDDPNTNVQLVRHGGQPTDAASLNPDTTSKSGNGKRADAISSSEPELEISAPVAGTETQTRQAEASGIGTLRSVSNTVRVDVRKLDELMNLVGELVIQRNTIAGVAARLLSDAQTVRIGAELAKTNKVLDRKLKALQSGVLDVRMVPLRQIFEKLSRVVRRLCRDLGKDVELDFKGANTELDKLIVEQLVDPLVHIVRNAFDHALEISEERESVGKAPTGRIRISAFQRGNHVIIEVEDDGRGMNVDAIRAKAVASGLVGENETLSRGEVLNLIFEPGLSTADEVSSISGRGVGMDIVRSNLADMGGMVDVETVEGRGTTVTITLPITLAIIQALIVRVSEERFAIPLNSVLETMALQPGQVGHSEGREILNVRGEPLLLRRLCEEFEIEGSDRGEQQFVVVLGMGEQRLGLLVDRLEGQQDTVIKSIKGPIQYIRGISGATELGDGSAVLVIDVSAIVGDAVRRREAA